MALNYQEDAYDDTNLRAPTMSQQEAEIAQELVERTALMGSVNWLGNHLPFCVLNRLRAEVKRNFKSKHCGSYDQSMSSEPGSEINSFDFSREMILTQDLQNEILRETRRTKGSNDNLHGSVRIDGGLGTLSEESVGDDEKSLNFREIETFRPLRRRRASLDANRTDFAGARMARRSSLGAVQMKRASYESFGEVSELSFDSFSSNEFDGYGSRDTVTEPQPQDADGDDRAADSRDSDSINQPPFASSHECALLFIDISGFTKLATRLDPEKLSKVINAYFELIVNLVTQCGGDILKFAGDALFGEWRRQESATSLKDCVAMAATCGAKIVRKCSDYPVYSNGESGKLGRGVSIATLNVHGGLGAGMLMGVHVGDDKKREYVILGDPIDQVAEAAHGASLGELCASPKFLEMMVSECQMRFDESFSPSASDKPTVIARKRESCFEAQIPRQQRRMSTHHVGDSWSTEQLREYRNLISYYAHPVLVDNEMNSSQHLRITSSTTRQRHAEEAELRNVFVMFIAPLIPTTLSGDEDTDYELFSLLNSIMNVTTRELDRFGGHLRQFIVDDKGLVLIATFGLRGSTSPNMVTEKALPATLNIHNALTNELNVQNQVGATLGTAYCGVVGGVKRHEYAVMGPSVNLAARLMCSRRNPGILVDDAVRAKAGKFYAFDALHPVVAKGYPSPVPIFELISSLERRWGKKSKEFVGRRMEQFRILALATQAAECHSKARMMMITAESGTGKSTLVVHAIEKLRKTMSKNKDRFTIAKHIASESDMLVPFSLFRSILPDILIDKGDEATTASGSGSSAGFDSKNIGDWDVASKKSKSSRARSMASGHSGASSCSSDQVAKIMNMIGDIDAPEALFDLVGRHLMGLNPAEMADHADIGAQKSSLNGNAAVTYMVKLFQKFCQGNRLTVLALDDVHQMDEMSWQVVQKLFESSQNLFIICTSRPFKDYKILIDDAFWTSLKTGYKEDGRFEHMELGRFTESDIRELISKKFQLDPADIEEKFYHDVYTQSSGMPHFANEILSSANRRNSVGRKQDNLLGWTNPERGKGELTQESVGDMIVARLDSFDKTHQNVINLGAVLGASFDLFDVLDVMEYFVESSDPDEEIGEMTKVGEALSFFVEEGILIELRYGGSGESKHIGVGDYIGIDDSQSRMSELKDCTYTFCHDIWRSTILEKMLQTRKRQIHRTIARCMERRIRSGSDDYVVQMKLWQHWHLSGEKIKSSEVALTVGESYGELGMHEQSIQLYTDTLNQWGDTSNGTAARITVLRDEVISTLDVKELENVIKIYTALGKALATTHRGAESVMAYQTALQLVQTCPAATRINDRSIIFPIFSGLFLALKFGQIEQDGDCRYEQNLVSTFVTETKEHGDPIHFTRALAMQAVMYGRLQNFKRAFEVFDELKDTYDPDQHSAAISSAYGSDRVAQVFALTTLWHFQLGRTAAAVRTCEFIFEVLMPKMDLKNVHNSAIILYPTIWILQQQGRSLEMLEIFVQYVVDPFDEFFGEGAFTFCLPVYDPIMMLLDLSDKGLTKEIDGFDDYVDWASFEENLRFGTVINNSLGQHGRDCNSLSAEICLLLARRSELEEEDRHATRETLVKNGLVIARESVEFTSEKKMVAANMRATVLLKELDELALDLSIDF